MYALGEQESPPTRKYDPLVKEVGSIMELRQRVLAGSDFGYLPPLAQLLIEHEIPRLIALLATRGVAAPAAKAVARR